MADGRIRKTIKTDEEMYRAMRNFYDAWEKRHIPDTRKIIWVRKAVKEEEGLITHNRLVFLIKDKYGYCERTVNKMLEYMVENDILNETFVDGEFDLRYYVLDR